MNSTRYIVIHEWCNPYEGAVTVLTDTNSFEYARKIFLNEYLLERERAMEHDYFIHEDATDVGIFDAGKRGDYMQEHTYLRIETVEAHDE